MRDNLDDATLELQERARGIERGQHAWPAEALATPPQAPLGVGGDQPPGHRAPDVGRGDLDVMRRQDLAVGALALQYLRR